MEMEPTAKRGRGRPRLYTDEQRRERAREAARKYNRKQRATDPRAWLIQKSRASAQTRGLDHTITVDDIQWPTHCPVLGIALDYLGERGWEGRENGPSFDRWDNDQGYVPGNVRVISWRANRLKNNGTWQELMAVARYARYGQAHPELADIW